MFANFSYYLCLVGFNTLLHEKIAQGADIPFQGNICIRVILEFHHERDPTDGNGFRHPDARLIKMLHLFVLLTLLDPTCLKGFS